MKGRILGQKPLLNIQKVFTEVRREKSHQKVMLNGNAGDAGSHRLSSGGSQELDSSALALSNNRNGKGFGARSCFYKSSRDGPDEVIGARSLKKTNGMSFQMVNGTGSGLLMQNEPSTNLNHTMSLHSKI